MFSLRISSQVLPKFHYQGSQTCLFLCRDTILNTVITILKLRIIVLDNKIRNKQLTNKHSCSLKQNQLDAVISEIYFWNETLHVSDSSSVLHQEFSIVRTAMVYVIQICWQLVSRSICSCSQAVSKPVWRVQLLCVQWKTPDDAQKNCPKHVEFHSKNKSENLLYTGCNRRNGPDFGRVFLRSNYTDITQNTYIQCSMVREILAIEKCGLLWCLLTVLITLTSYSSYFSRIPRYR